MAPVAGRILRTLPLAALAALAALACACEPQLVVGQWTCSDNGQATQIPAKTDPVAVPWSTGFENGFCDYTELAGFCIQDANASYAIVTSPVHSGKYAAAFSVTTMAASYQARCVRQGGLPTAAYYGAWYYVPALATNTAVWNLLHFEGGTPAATHGLWDVSLRNTASGSLQLDVYDFLNAKPRTPMSAPTIPIATWFHIQFYLKRASDATGEVALYQDGQQLFDLQNLVTDDSSYGQWYVGNIVSGLTPPDSTVYVDDVTIGPTL